MDAQDVAHFLRQLVFAIRVAEALMHVWLYILVIWLAAGVLMRDAFEIASNPRLSYRRAEFGSILLASASLYLMITSTWIAQAQLAIVARGY